MLFLAIAGVSLGFFVGWFAWTRHYSPSAHARRVRAKEATASLRQSALSGGFPVEVPLEDETDVRSVAMDWRTGQKQMLTLISHADGTTSIYLSSGTAIIGAAEHQSIRILSTRFREGAKAMRDSLRATTTWPNPPVGCAVYYLVTREGTLASAPYPVRELIDRGHPFHEVGVTSQALITAIRKSARSRQGREAGA